MNEIRYRVAIDAKDATVGAAQVDAAVARLASTQGQLNSASKLTGQQTAALSAQMQDLFIQIQGGQAPLTALLQQGSQVASQFGGMSNAGRALLGLVTPMSVGLTAVGGAAVLAGTAFLQGARESKALRDGLALTGNTAGITAGQLDRMAASMADARNAAIGDTRELVNALATSGTQTSGTMEAAARAALALSAVNGKAAAENIAAFDGMAEGVAKWALKANASYHFLTAAQYEHIKSLEEQGRTTEAARTGLEALAGTLESRTAPSLGTIERALKGVTNWWSRMWDAAKDIGRDQTLDAKIAKLKADIEGMDAWIRKGAGTGSTVFADASRELEQLQREAARRDGRATDKAAEQKAEEDTIRRREALAAITDRLAGVNGNFNASLRVLHESYKQGDLTLDAYRQKVEQLIKAEGGGKALSDKARADAEEEARLVMVLSGVTQDYAKQLTTLQALRRRGVVDEARYVELVEALIARQPSAQAASREQERAMKAALEVAQARQEAMRKEGAAIDGVLARRQAEAEQTIRGQRDKAAGLEVEIAAMDIARARNISLAEAVDTVTIARLREKQALMTEGSPEWERLQKEIAARERVLQLIEVKRSKEGNDNLLKRIDQFLDPSKAEEFGAALTNAFEGAGNSIAAMVNALRTYARQQAQVGDMQAELRARYELGMVSEADYIKRNTALEARRGEQQLGSYASMAGAAKGFFEAGSRGYKAMEAAETAFRAAQLASDLAKGLSSAAVGIANQAQGDPYTALPRMALMAAAMASLGFATGFFGTSTSGAVATASARQGGAATGRLVGAGDVMAGTVLGDADARSASIANGIEALRDIADVHLRYASGMLSSLRSIEASMSGLATLVVRAGGITSGKNLNIQEGVLAVNRGDPLTNALGLKHHAVIDDIAPFVATLHGLWGKTKQSIADSGLSITGSVADLMGGRGVQQYADVSTTKSSWFGLKKDTTTSTVLAPVEDEISRQFGLVFQGIGSALADAAGALGRDAGAIGESVADFYVDIARLSLKDLKGDDLQEAISAAIGSQADAMAALVLPGLDAFQRVGEGYFETLTRVAAGVEESAYYLDLLGISAVDYASVLRKQGDVSAEITRQSIAAAEVAEGALNGVGKIISTFDGSASELVDTYRALVGVRGILADVGISSQSLTTEMLRAAGGLDALQSSALGYREAFFTQAEQQASAINSLTGELAKLGIDTVPTTREAFRALISAQKDGTAQGQALIAKLLGLADAFDQVATHADSVRDKRAQLEIQLMRLGGDELGALNRERQIELDALRAIDPALAALQETVNSTADASSRADRRLQLELQLMRAQGDEAGALALERQRELDALRELDPALAGMQARIYELSDAARNGFDVSTRQGAGSAKAAYDKGMAAARDATWQQEVQAEFLAQIKTPGSSIWRYIQDRGIDASLLPPSSGWTVAGDKAIAGITTGALFNWFSMERAAAEEAVAPGTSRGNESISDGMGAYTSAAQQEAQRLLDEEARKRQELEREQMDVTRALIDQLDSLESSLEDFGRELLLGDLSVLSPEQQYAQAQAARDTVLAQARAGDLAALEAYQGIARELLEISRTYNGGEGMYVADVQRVQRENAELVALMQRIEANTGMSVKVSAAAGTATVEALRDGNAITEQSIAYQALARSQRVG